MPAFSPDYWQRLTGWQIALNVLPFAALLLLIAVMPLIPRLRSWWERHSNKFLVSLVLGAAGLALYLAPTGDWGRVAATYLDYLAFISLLTSLFVVSGGIHISGAFAGFPRINTLFLGLGALLANVLGTTGASMLLIRPLIRANHHRRHKTHIIVFFIFIVSNCGGLLTPLGDPPLYLGFLRGVPFAWTLRLWPQWALAVLTLLFIFYLLDERFFLREDAETKGRLAAEISGAPHRLRIQGRRNLALLAAILATVLFSGSVLVPLLRPSLGAEAANEASKLFQIVMLAAIAWTSARWTRSEVHAHNNFVFAPILEVAALFFGIFGAMLPVLVVLERNAHALNLFHPWQYFWLSGFLSSFLDNAPTYLSFAALAAGKAGLASDHLGALAVQFPNLLAAISTGTVLMGANTYIGNGPNFMVKSLAEQARIKMPSFGGYLLWSVAILLPLYLLETFLFFR
jgi:Na+/H+ antiporter NhaD/arsenite permease-like protein